MGKEKRKGPAGILSPEHRSLAFKMHVEGVSTVDILKHFDSENISCPKAAALGATFKSKCHQPEIQKYRDIYYARIKDVPLAHKRTRLETRQDIVNILKKAFRAMLNKDGDIKPKSFKKFMAVIKRVEEILTGAQDEMERKPGIVFQLAQRFGNDSVTLQELLVEERSILKRLEDLRARGISLPSVPVQGNKEGEKRLDIK